MQLLNAITKRGYVVKNETTNRRIAYKIRCFGKLFFLSYIYSDDGWNYEITDKFENVLDTGIYAPVP